MNKRLKYSRWKRSPGIFRTGDGPRSDSGNDETRLVLYLNWRLLDQAEELSKRSGAESLQRYCERLLSQAIEGELVLERLRESEERRGAPLEGVAEVAADPGYLAEWSGNVDRSEAPTVTISSRVRPPVGGMLVRLESRGEEPGEGEGMAAMPGGEGDALELVIEAEADEVGISGVSSGGDTPREVVFRHAGVGERLGAQEGLLAFLRNGEPCDESRIAPLLEALRLLEREWQGRAELDRQLVYALHRLAFEGQVLVTDAWPGRAWDAATIQALRMVQEAVDRILSGEDIRYDVPDQATPFE
jgi:hypothetical protein